MYIVIYVYKHIYIYRTSLAFAARGPPLQTGSGYVHALLDIAGGRIILLCTLYV